MAWRSAALNCLVFATTSTIGPPTRSESGVMPVSKRLSEILDFPIVQFALRDVRNAALACRALATREPPSSDNGAKKIARRVAFGAVAGTVDEIGATIPLRRLCRSLA